MAHNAGADCVLGLDTSNYTTSAALADRSGRLVADCRQMLAVKAGGRGLRQSEALFQHMKNLPDLTDDLLRAHGRRVSAVAASIRPRPAEGSYMPVFLAGMHFGQGIAAALNVPFLPFSHQEGHIRAGMQGTGIRPDDDFLAWHLSGGTSELLLVRRPAQDAAAGTQGAYDLSVVGGSRDISFGQLLDRTGVALGLSFPAGAEMDALARGAGGGALTKIPTDGLYCNLSGIESQCLRRIKEGQGAGNPNLAAALVSELFEKIADCLLTITQKACRPNGPTSGVPGAANILFTGGVSASGFLRRRIAAACGGAVFGEASLSPDNAAGIALLGADGPWNENRQGFHR
ncbi:MAG: O-sialoglycoprotein endopeptidase [Clostridiales Family XIII bacterium]|jgi:N6-L-threonylcarbamoyladenine synthase|nr:O-sialoglycoprotein endopeptidase [Clostridiales Family XIII bacterium]